MKCPRCNRNKANYSSEYGVLYCDICQNEDNKINRPSQSASYDFASPTTKKQRKEYAKSMLQPYVGGILSREFIEVWGTDKLAGVTKKDIKNAKYVYGDFVRAHKIKDSKI